MEKFSLGLKELKEIRNLIDPTIEEEIERIRKIYELKLETIVSKMERINKKAVENEKSLDDILNKYQVEIEAMKADFIRTTELQNKRIQGAFDEQNDVLKDFDSDLNSLEQRFKIYQDEQITQIDEVMKNVNDMVVETKKVIDQHNRKIDEQFDDWDVRKNRNDLELEAKMSQFNKVADKITQDNLKNEKFKNTINDKIDEAVENVNTLEKEMKELVGVVKLLDTERIQDGKITDELQVKVRSMEGDINKCIEQVKGISKGNREMHEDFYNNIVVHFDQFKQASVEDFNSLNKRMNSMVPVLEHVSELDQEIELLKKRHRPKIVYNKKDIKSPLTSVMQEMEIDNKRLSLSNSKSRERRERDYYASTAINLGRRHWPEDEEEEQESQKPDEEESERSRGISPVEEIMRKDFDSRRKFERLQKASSAADKSRKPKEEIKESQVQKLKGRSVITPSEESNESDVTFRQGDKTKPEDDLKVEDLTNIGSSQRQKREYFKKSGRDKHDPHKGILDFILVFLTNTFTLYFVSHDSLKLLHQ